MPKLTTKFTSTRLLLIISAILLIVILSWLISYQTPIKVVRAKSGQLVEAVYATGVVEATAMYPISALQSGRIKALYVDEGDVVSKGEELVYLDQPEIEAAIEQLRVTEEYYSDRVKRLRELNAARVVSKEVFEKAESEYLATRAQRRVAEEKASLLLLKAVQDGIVIQRDGEIGELIPANKEIFWLRSMAPLRVSASVDEEDVVKLAVGQDVLLQTDAYPNEVFRGLVESITPKGDPISRTTRVRISLKDPDKFPIGMTLEVNIIIKEKKDAILLPKSSVNSIAAVTINEPKMNDFIWIVGDDGKLDRQNVVVGVVGDDEVEIISGAQIGDKIVLEPNDLLRKGRKVSIEEVSL